MTLARSPVAVIIPAYNEESHIGGLLTQLLRNSDSILAEVLVADGRSDDATRSIVADFAGRDRRVSLVDNPERRQSAGVNRAARLADPTCGTLVRMDAHSHYPDDFLARLVGILEESDSDSVVVRLRTVGRNCLERAIAAALNSRFGTGGAAHRIGGYSGFIDHGHHAAFRRSSFDQAGGYDAAFVANEDAEFDCRLRRIGGRIWLAGELEVDYFPRRSLHTLAKQYWRYGQGRAQTWLKHRERLRLRQMVPPLVAALVLAGIGFASLLPELLLFPLAYLSGCVAAGALLALRCRSACVLLAGPALATIHMAWGLGFLAKIVPQLLWEMVSRLRGTWRAAKAEEARNCNNGGGI